MGMFDSLFGDGAQAPTMPKLDIDAALNKTQSWNNSAIQNWMQTSPELTKYMQEQFNSLSPNVQSSLNQNYSLGSELANKGYTSVMGDFMKQLTSNSLAAGSLSGMPIGSAYTANLGAGIGAQQLLSNQLSGSSLLSTTANQQSSLNQYLMSPSLSTLSSNMTNTGQILNAEMYNNQIDQQNAMINAVNSQSSSWFDNLLGSTVGSIVATPFRFLTNANSVAQNAPAMAGGWFGSMFGNVGSMAM